MNRLGKVLIVSRDRETETSVSRWGPARWLQAVGFMFLTLRNRLLYFILVFPSGVLLDGSQTMVLIVAHVLVIGLQCASW